MGIRKLGGVRNFAAKDGYGGFVGYVGEMRGLVGCRPLLLAAAGVIVVDGLGRWLLQGRVDDGRRGLIGGALELGESFEDAARRELFEDSGLAVEVLHQPDGAEGSELGWFSPDQLPALSGYNELLTARARASLASLRGRLERRSRDLAGCVRVARKPKIRASTCPA